MILLGPGEGEGEGRWLDGSFAGLLERWVFGSYLLHRDLGL